MSNQGPPSVMWLSYCIRKFYAGDKCSVVSIFPSCECCTSLITVREESPCHYDIRDPTQTWRTRLALSLRVSNTEMNDDLVILTELGRKNSRFCSVSLISQLFSKFQQFKSTANCYAFVEIKKTMQVKWLSKTGVSYEHIVIRTFATITYGNIVRVTSGLKRIQTLF